MTTRKKTTTNDAVDKKDADGAQAEAINETTPDNGAAEYPTFTIEINGQELELEDRWTNDAAPAGMMFVFHEHYAQKYIPGVLEQIIGEDQVISLIEAGLAMDDLQKVFLAWGERRQGK